MMTYSVKKKIPISYLGFQTCQKHCDTTCFMANYNRSCACLILDKYSLHFFSIKKLIFRFQALIYTIVGKFVASVIQAKTFMKGDSEKPLKFM